MYLTHCTCFLYLFERWRLERLYTRQTDKIISVHRTYQSLLACLLVLPVLSDMCRLSNLEHTGRDLDPGEGRDADVQDREEEEEGDEEAGDDGCSEELDSFQQGSIDGGVVICRCRRGRAERLGRL